MKGVAGNLGLIQLAILHARQNATGGVQRIVVSGRAATPLQVIPQEVGRAAKPSILSTQREVFFPECAGLFASIGDGRRHVVIAAGQLLSRAAQCAVVVGFALGKLHRRRAIAEAALRLHRLWCA